MMHVVANAYLITDNVPLSPTAVEQAVESGHWPSCRAAEIAGASWREFRRRSLSWQGIEDAAALVDRIAPEHLENCDRGPQEPCSQTCVMPEQSFFGRHTPEAMGDYIAGPNHVLPTGTHGAFLFGAFRPRFPQTHDASFRVKPVPRLRQSGSGRDRRSPRPKVWKRHARSIAAQAPSEEMSSSRGPAKSEGGVGVSRRCVTSASP
jgi:hypothetical protein